MNIRNTEMNEDSLDDVSEAIANYGLGDQTS